MTTRRSVPGRQVGALCALAVAGTLLAACGSDSNDAGSTETVTETVSAQPGTPAESSSSSPRNSGIVPPHLRGAALCRSEGKGDADTCVLAKQTVTGDVAFTSAHVVKLIDSTFSGSVRVSGAQQVIVTGTTVRGGLGVESSGGAVIKMSEVGGSLSVSGAGHATLVKNTVKGDLRCDVRGANGAGNSVGGATTGACGRLR